MNNKTGDWMQTYSGIKFFPLNADIEDINIEDIARSLSMLCRFNGHSKYFYSVAQHSVLISHHMDAKDALWGLLHDATEAYLGDLIRPLKRSPGFEEFSPIEEKLMNVIAKKFNLLGKIPQTVKIEDNRALMTEKRDVMGPAPSKWAEIAEPWKEKIVPWSSEESYERFIERFNELTNNNKQLSFQWT